MEKTCPKCSNTFTCRVDNITLCNCRKIKLKTGVREYIKQRWGRCLCLDCLQYINENIMEYQNNVKAKTFFQKEESATSTLQNKR